MDQESDQIPPPGLYNKLILFINKNSHLLNNLYILFIFSRCACNIQKSDWQFEFKFQSKLLHSLSQKYPWKGMNPFLLPPPDWTLAFVSNQSRRKRTLKFKTHSTWGYQFYSKCHCLAWRGCCPILYGWVYNRHTF